MKNKHFSHCFIYLLAILGVIIPMRVLADSIPLQRLKELNTEINTEKQNSLMVSYDYENDRRLYEQREELERRQQEQYQYESDQQWRYNNEQLRRQQQQDLDRGVRELDQLFYGQRRVETKPWWINKWLLLIGIFGGIGVVKILWK